MHRFTPLLLLFALWESSPVSPSVEVLRHRRLWVCPSRRSPVMDDGSLSLTARTSTSSSTSNYASRQLLSSVCTTLVAWARSRRFSQMEPHSGSLLLPFLFPLAAQLPVHLVWWLLCLQWSVLPTTRTARAAIRVDRPTSLVSVSCLMPCLCIYTCSSLPCLAGAVRRDAMINR